MRRNLTILSMLTALAAIPASAGEVGLLLDKQIGKAQAASGALGTRKYDAVSPTGFGPISRSGSGLLSPNRRMHRRR